MMRPVGEFLGLAHDLEKVHSHSVVDFWPRERLIRKVSDRVAVAIERNTLPAGIAGKMFGCLNFLSSGMYGKLARAGLNAIKGRQFQHACLKLTPALRQAFAQVQALLQEQPRRCVELAQLAMPRRDSWGHRMRRWSGQGKEQEVC